MKKEIIKFGSIVFIIDLISKIIIDNIMYLNETKNIIYNFFSCTKVYNTGASFSTMMGYRYLFILVAGIALYFIYKSIDSFKVNKRNILAFSLLLGGILGNLVDRIIYGHVIDFLDFKIFNYNFPVFNIADSAICIGVCLLLIAVIKSEDNYGNKSK